jgi:hypothetical protein
MKTTVRGIALTGIYALLAFTSGSLVWPQVSSNSIPLNAATWTPVGPAPAVNGRTTFVEDTSGRITAIAGHPTDPNVIYVAAAGGGVWKTTDGGTTWTPLTDAQNTLFMGAIALAPSNPDVIYAGTGEANMGPSKAAEIRANIYYGLGLLKSADGGASWTLAGSAEFNRRTISRIVVDPTTSDTVYVAVGALGINGLPGNTGIWKSADGGATWTNTTASISTEAAFSDLAIDPSAAQTLYAAVGAPGGDPANSVYKTTDGGATWAVAGDFPTGATNPQLGRIALAISPAAPQIIYASIARPGPPVSQTNSLFRIMKSTDGGAGWTTLPTPPSICPDNGMVNYLGSAGDYHQALAVDPANADIVYAGGLCVIGSTTGGLSWDPIPIAPGDTGGPHRDHHALTFDANGTLLNGNDGGIWRLSDPAGPTWDNLNTNLQIAQFVGIALHPTDPDTAYGGTQDTGVMKFRGDVRWVRQLRGDGGAFAVNAPSPNRVYVISRSACSDNNYFKRSNNGGDPLPDGTGTWVTQVSGIDPIPTNPCDPRLNFYPPFVLEPASATPLRTGCCWAPTACLKPSTARECGIPSVRRA